MGAAGMLQDLLGGVGLVGGGGALGYLVRRWLATERPFLATIKHQDAEIASLRAERAADAAYILLLVTALRESGIDVPLPPAAS